MKYLKKLSILIMIFLIFPMLAVTSFAQEPGDYGAEVSILPVGEIPAMVVNQENTLKLRFDDNFGVNWTILQYYVPPPLSVIIDGSRGLGRVISFFWTRLVFPIVHPSWKPFLGYSSIRFQADVVGNPDGWVASVYPNTIGQSTDGTNADLTLKVYVTDLAVVNTITARVAVTRFLKDGSEYGTSYFDIPLRSQKLNWISIVPDDTAKRVPPDSMVTFDIEITNLGYFVDTFALKTTSNSDVKALLSEQSYVLQPNETRRVTLWVYTPETFFDPGTSHVINITAYSLKFPEREFSGGVQVYTHGFYFSPLSLFYIGIILLILIIIYILYHLIIGRKFRELYCKPQKPWIIPEEKRHLEELKQKNKEEFEKERQMMEDEYKSALLWYKNYRDAERQRGKKEISESKQSSISKKIFKKKEKDEKTDKDKTIDKKKQKKETGNKITQFLKKPKKKNNKNKLTKAISLPKKQKPKKPVKKKKVEESKDANKIQVKEKQKNSEEQRRKEKLLLQIKRDQVKQKKMIK